MAVDLKPTIIDFDQETISSDLVPKEIDFGVQEKEEDEGTGLILSGVRGAVEGLSSIPKLFALGVDASLDTDYFKEATEITDNIKNFIADEPTSTGGKISEGLTSFLTVGGPLIWGVSKAHRVANFGRNAVTPPTSKYMKAMVALGDSKAGKVLFKKS